MSVKTPTRAQTTRPIEANQARADALPAYQARALKWAMRLEEGEGELPPNLQEFLPERKAPRAAKAVRA